jgi:hypothetical protein
LEEGEMWLDYSEKRVLEGEKGRCERLERIKEEGEGDIVRSVLRN